MREALLACEAEGVEAWVSADFIQTLFTHVQFDQFAGQPLLIYRTAPAISWELVAKRIIDVVGVRCAPGSDFAAHAGRARWSSA